MLKDIMAIATDLYCYSTSKNSDFNIPTSIPRTLAGIPTLPMPM